MLYTVSDARTEVNRFVEAGMCPDAEDTLEWINRAVRRLMEMADTQYITKRIRLRVENNTVVLPRQAGKLLAVDLNGSPARIWSNAYEFMPNGPGDLKYNGATMSEDLLDLGDGWPIWYEIPAYYAPLKIIVLSTEQDDVDAEMLIRGSTTNGHEIFTDGVPGETLAVERWMRGVEGSLSYSLMTGSTNLFNTIDSIIKPVTTGYVTLIAYDESTNGMWLLGKYHPKETVPSFRRYKLTGVSESSISSDWIANIKTWQAGIFFGVGEYCKYGGNYYRCNLGGYSGATAPTHTTGQASDGVCSWIWISEAALSASYSTDCATCVYGMVKLRFIPLVYDNEVLPIQSLDAIKNMIISIREEDNGNFDTAQAYNAYAAAFLDRKEEDIGSHEYVVQVQVSPEPRDFNII